MEYMLGEIQMFSFGFAPMDWLLCDGRALSIQQNAALYSLIGTIFGGDGKTTFCIPNLMNSSPVDGMAYYIATAGIYPMRP